MPPLDRFSAQAAAYARYRIDYPADLYAWLWPQVAGRQRAWDRATGHDPVAAVLAGPLAARWGVGTREVSFTVFSRAERVE